MANYKTHSFFNIFVALPLILFFMICFCRTSYQAVVIFTCCFTYATLYMNPDLDLSNKIRLFSLRGFLTMPFRGYSLIFRHRGISHSLLFGSVTRILYLGLLFYLFLYILKKPNLSKKHFLMILRSNYFLYGFIAIMLADFFHLALDAKKR